MRRGLGSELALNGATAHAFRISFTRRSSWSGRRAGVDRPAKAADMGGLQTMRHCPCTWWRIRDLVRNAVSGL